MGTGLWRNSQEEALKKGTIKQSEVFGCRENVKNFLVDGGIEEVKAFYIVESLRKGKKLKPDELELVKNCKLNRAVIKNILGIKYLFPEAHAISYASDAYSIGSAKLYYPAAFYPVLLSQYAGEVSEFDYQAVMDCKTLEELKTICKTYSVGQNQASIIKFKTRLAWLIWEAKLRGFDLKPATLFSKPNVYSLNEENQSEILMPLTSLSGVAETTALKIYESVKAEPLKDYQDVLERKDPNNKKVFNKKALQGLGLFELTEEQIERFNVRLNKHYGRV